MERFDAGIIIRVTLTYHLVGNDTVYDISLDRDYIGQAKVLLPASSYYESGTIDVELAQDAFAPDDAAAQRKSWKLGKITIRYPQEKPARLMTLLL